MKLLSPHRVLVGRFVIESKPGLPFTSEQLKMLNHKEQDSIDLTREKVLAKSWSVWEVGVSW